MQCDFSAGFGATKSTAALASTLCVHPQCIPSVQRKLKVQQGTSCIFSLQKTVLVLHYAVGKCEGILVDVRFVAF